MPPRVTVTDERVDRYIRRWFRRDVHECLLWRDLERVLMDAEASLVGEDDVFVLLISRDGSGVALGYNDAKRVGVLERLHALYGYDYDAEARVMASAHARLQVWPPVEDVSA